MNETTVKIEMGKTDLQLASTEVIKRLALNHPVEEECTTAYFMAYRYCLMYWNRHSKTILAESNNKWS